MAKMADLSSVVQAINDLVVRIERLNDQSEIGSVVLRLDYITRMLVNLDVADDLVNTMSCLRETVLAIEADQGHPTRNFDEKSVRESLLVLRLSDNALTKSD